VLVVSLDGVPPRHAVQVLSQVQGLGGQVGVAEGPGSGTITVRIPCV
jgi:hypothetical protein